MLLDQSMISIKLSNLRCGAGQKIPDLSDLCNDDTIEIHTLVRTFP